MPILDTGLVFAFRGFIKRRSLFAADNNHFHHRLLRLGLKHRSVVLVMYAITAICASLGIFMLTAEGDVSVQFMVAGLVLLLTMFACLQKGRYLKIFKGFRRNLAIAKKAKKQTHSFEVAQVKMNEIVSFDSWWNTLCTMGDNMSFKSIALLHRDNDQYINIRQWNTKSNDMNLKNKTVELNMPLESFKNVEHILRVQIFTEDYLELSGNQVRLLTRLIDEFPPPDEFGNPETVDVKPIRHIDSEIEEENPEIAIVSIRKNNYIKENISNQSCTSHDSFADSIKSISLGFCNLFRQHK